MQNIKTEEEKIKSKIIISDIIANASKLKDHSKRKKKKFLNSERLEKIIGNGGIEIESISNAVIFQSEYSKENLDGIYYGGIYLDPSYILSKGIVSPELGTEEIRIAFGVKTNKEVFKAIFTEDEITEIATNILSLKGGAFTIENELKN